MREIAIVVLVFSMVFAGVYAINWILQGRITGNVTVAQWVLIDGMTMPEAGEITESVDATPGFTSYGNTHNLKLANVADRILTVTIESEQAPGLQVFQEFKLTEPNDCVRFTNEPTTWGDFKSISFEYYIESGNLWIPHVNIYMKNINCAVTTKGVKGETGEAGKWYTVTYTKDDFSVLFGTLTDDGEFGPEYGFVIESYWSTDSWNTDNPQVVWFRNVVAYNTADEAINITGIRLVPNISPYNTLEAPLTVDFRIGYYPTAGIGVVAIETDVYLIGEAEAGIYP